MSDNLVTEMMNKIKYGGSKVYYTLFVGCNVVPYFSELEGFNPYIDTNKKEFVKIGTYHKSPYEEMNVFCYKNKNIVGENLVIAFSPLESLHSEAKKEFLNRNLLKAENNNIAKIRLVD